ncbi:MAG: DUF4367 domain-containing protein [Anaerolineales bacterium]|nr:DUF4367 domain-containing protein [Anaerolineales bacterium]
MKDDFLYQFQKPPRKQFAADLYKRISQPMLNKPALRRRLIYTFTALLVALIGTLSISPAARAMAADFLRQIGIFNLSERPAGDYVNVSPPSAEQLAAANATATPLPSQPEAGSSLEIAISRAGFLPYLPAELPSGYELQDIVAADYIDDLGTEYGKGIFAKYASEGGGLIEIQTNVFDGREIDVPVGGLRITDTEVNGQPGVWIEDLSSINGAIDMLIWEEDGFYLSIQSNQLTLEEVLNLAASLKQ